MSNNASSNTPITRRRFIYSSALAAGAAAIAGPAIAQSTRKLSANDKLNIGVVGVMGKGASDMELCSGENIVAICDVDESGSAGARSQASASEVLSGFPQDVGH